MKKMILAFFSSLLLTLASSGSLFAQTSEGDLFYTLDEKNWIVDIPLWIPGFRGQLAYGEIELSSDNSTESPERERIEDDFGIQFYFAGRAEYWIDDLLISLDLFSGSVGNSFSINSSNGNINKQFVSFEASGTIPRLTFGYTVLNKIGESGIGYRM